jgi:hypothetical protein
MSQTETGAQPAGEAILTEKGGRPEVVGESDRLIVLRARESRVHRKGVGKVTQPAKETSTGQEGPEHEANLPAGYSKQGGNSNGITCRSMCEASNFEEPRAVIPHAGICTGAAG